MNYRKLGRTDLTVSEISIGCSGYWGNKRFSDNVATTVINEAFHRGVNFFDTGHNYCNFNAEPRLGRIVKQIVAKTDRSRVVISTKAGSVIGSAPIIAKCRGKTQDFSPEAIELSCSESIRNLNCGYLDIFQLHGASEAQISEPLLERLLSMKRKGMFRYLGVNTHTEADMRYVSKHPDIFDMVLIDYNLLQLDRETVINELRRSGIGIVVGTVLAQGHLVKRNVGSFKTGAYFWYLARTLIKPTSRRLADNSREMRNVLSSISEMSAAQAAFAYILENSAVSSCVLGTTSINNLIEVIGATDKRLEENNKLAIRRAFEKMQMKISA